MHLPVLLWLHIHLLHRKHPVVKNTALVLILLYFFVVAALPLYVLKIKPVRYKEGF